MLSTCARSEVMHDHVFPELRRIPMPQDRCYFFSERDNVALRLYVMSIYEHRQTNRPTNWGGFRSLQPAGLTRLVKVSTTSTQTVLMKTTITTRTITTRSYDPPCPMTTFQDRNWGLMSMTTRRGRDEAEIDWSGLLRQ